MSVNVISAQEIIEDEVIDSIKPVETIKSSDVAQVADTTNTFIYASHHRESAHFKIRPYLLFRSRGTVG